LYSEFVIAVLLVVSSKTKPSRFQLVAATVHFFFVKLSHLAFDLVSTVGADGLLDFFFLNSRLLLKQSMSHVPIKVLVKQLLVMARCCGRVPFQNHPKTYHKKTAPSCVKQTARLINVAHEQPLLQHKNASTPARSQGRIKTRETKSQMVTQASTGTPALPGTAP
jgi:hypothetical protein